MAGGVVKREEIDAIVSRYRDLERELAHLKAEFAVDAGEPGVGEMPTEEFYEMGDRLSKLTDVHLIWTTLALIEHQLACLSGKNNDQARMLMLAVAQTLERFAPDPAIEEALALLEDDNPPKFDLSYLDEEGDDAV